MPSYISWELSCPSSPKIANKPRSVLSPGVWLQTKLSQSQYLKTQYWQNNREIKGYSFYCLLHFFLSQTLNYLIIGEWLFIDAKCEACFQNKKFLSWEKSKGTAHLAASKASYLAILIKLISIFHGIVYLTMKLT